MDINMPVMDGFEATTRIISMQRKFAALKAAPVVGLTAYHNEEYKLKCKESGMKLRIIKPLTKGKLKTVMDRFFHVDPGSITEQGPIKDSDEKET